MNGISGSGSGAYSTQGPSSIANANRFAHLDPLSQKILNYVAAQPETAEGVHLAHMARDVGGDAASIA